MKLFKPSTELQHATRQMNWCLLIVKGARCSIRHHSYVMGRLGKNSLLPESTRMKCQAFSNILYLLSVNLEGTEKKLRSIIHTKEN